MKRFLLCLLPFSAFSFLAHGQQVEINKPLVLTGATAADRQVKNLALPATSTDATSVESVQNGQLLYATATASNNDLLLVLTPAPAAYTVGMVVYFKVPAALSGPATVNLNGLGAKALKQSAAQGLVAFAGA